MTFDLSAFNDPDTLYAQMKQGCKNEWQSYCNHPFVQGIADGTLPLECFQHYLQQDYLFLIHFSRAYALAVYKAGNLDEMRNAAAAVSGILEKEMALHLGYCTQWGLTESDVVNQPEASANMAYTRYVLERGMAGDILDLYSAVVPCALGYTEIGQRLVNDPATKKEGNPYWSWIETYGSDDILENSLKMIGFLDQLAKTRFNDARLPSLQQTFREATRLEIGFWQMGLDQSF